MRRPGTFAAAIATALLAMSCGGGGGGSTPTTPSNPGTGGGGRHPVGRHDRDHRPGRQAGVHSEPGDGRGRPARRVQEQRHGRAPCVLDDGTVQTPDIAPGATSAAVAIGSNKSYHCTIHPGMVGGFNGTEVEPPPNCNQAYC